jgi:hypothetical protein
MMMPATTAVLPKAEAELRNLAKSTSLLALVGVVVVFAALLAALDALTLIEPFVRAATTWDWGLFGATLVALIHKLAPIIPAGFYLLAVLGAAGILDQIGKGEYFSARNIRALSDMGGSMTIGAFWAALLVPSIGDWTAGIGGYRVDFRPEVIVIFIIGAAIAVIGRLFLRAQRLEADMAEIL